jgi:hypothetical protein
VLLHGGVRAWLPLTTACSPQMCRVLFDAIERSLNGKSEQNLINKLFTVSVCMCTHVWGAPVCRGARPCAGGRRIANVVIEASSLMRVRSTGHVQGRRAV